MLTSDGCRARQQRLVEALAGLGVDGAIVSDRNHVYYLTGWRAKWCHASAAFVDADGRTTLVGAEAESAPAADEAIAYASNAMATMYSEQARRCAERLAAAIPPGKRLATDLTGLAAIAQLAGDSPADLTDTFFALRKRKDPDEIDCIKRSIAVSEAMYAAAREHLAPGANELDLFGKIRAAAILEAGEALEVMGNDFQAGTPAGPPRDRPVQAGELYILDAGPCVNGYHADNCRTFAVNGDPTDAQRAAQQHIARCFDHLEEVLKPGLSAADLFARAKAFLADGGHSGLIHHLGHGIGLAPHEPPQLNPEYDAVIEEGDVLTMEPGLYSDELNGGIRIEQNYRITGDGFERLTRYPLDL